MRVLFVGRSVYHFTYYQSILEALLADGAELVLRFDQAWSEGKPDVALRDFLARHPEVTRGWSRLRDGRSRGLVLAARELRSYSSYLRRSEQSEFYCARWRRYQSARVKRWDSTSLGRWVFGRKTLSRALEWGEVVLPAAHPVIDDVRDVAPDVVLASPANMRYAQEVEYLKAARRLRIPSAIMVLSWDNPSTKGLFHIRPDLLLAWNRTHVEETERYHGTPPSLALLSGAPFFDKWFDTPLAIEQRGAFCRAVGFPEDRPYVLYLGSSANIARDETWLVRELLQALDESSSLRRTSILARPHPANANHFVALAKEAGPRIVVWPPAGALPESSDMQADFCNSVRHAVGVVGVNTSAMLDSLILDKPCVAIITDRYQDTQLRAQHFRHLLQSGVLLVANNATESVRQLERLAAGEDELREHRQRFVREFVRPHGTEFSAGRLVAAAVGELAKGTPGALVSKMSAEQLLTA